MIIISHRGYWLESDEKNSSIAFERSFGLGFGTETDVRDCAGELVVSHNMPSGTEMTMAAFLSLPSARDLPLAINIKADGLTDALCHVMQDVADWFVFDMSIPDTRAWLKAGAPVMMRMSEVEPAPPWLDQAAGVWLDAFYSIWYDAALISDLLQRGLRVCVVSSELHGRDSLDQWHMLRPFIADQKIVLCTDWPEKAKAFFRESE